MRVGLRLEKLELPTVDIVEKMPPPELLDLTKVLLERIEIY
jgi:hypothetical protein